MSDQYILVVDDVAVNRLILMEIFRSDFKVLEAENGKDALEIIEKEKDNLAAIILDNMMPVMTGEQVLNVMHDEGLLAEIPTVMVTSSGGDDDEIKFLNIGAWDFIMKPFKPAIIKKRVNNLIEQHEYSRVKVENAKLVEQARIMKAHRKADERFRIMREKSRTILAEKDIVTGERFFTDNISEHFTGEYDKNTRLVDAWVNSGLVKPYDVKRAADYLERLYDKNDTGKTKELLLQMKRKDGSWQWYKMEALYYSGEDGENDRVILMVNNIDNLMKYQREVENNAEVVNRLTSTMSVGMFTCENDEKHTFTFIQDNFCALLGYKRNEIIGLSDNSLLGLVYKDDYKELEKNINSKFDGQNRYSTEYRLQKSNGEIIWVQNTCTLFLDQDGVIRIKNIITDVTKLKTAMEELRYRAEYDFLTGIPNKSTFYRETEKLIKANPKTKYVILRLDVERFKVVNDLYGIATGDAFLVHIADTMREIFDGQGTYAHLESDNFVACFPYDEKYINEVTTKITEAQKGFIPDFEIVIAYGCYIVDNVDAKVNLMSDRAYLALSGVKGMYLKRVGFYDESLMSKIKNEQQIVNDMNEALEREQFTVFFQPQFDHTTGKIISAEALSRWIHPTKNIISPGIFIPIFEKNGFIVKLDEYIWDKACEWQAKWIKQNPKKNPLPISVNISRLDIYNPHLCEILLSIIKKHGVNADLFRLEITESAYVENPSQLIETAETLRKHGFIVEMDDFGSGYSSLNTLKDVPVDVLKLDLRFLAGNSNLERSEKILVSIIEMAKNLELDIIAEGVETKEQADFLSSIGCSTIQGFYYSRPISISDFEKLLSDN